MIYQIRKRIAVLGGLVVLLSHAAIANADNQNTYQGDTIYDAAVNAAQQLKSQCRAIGQAMIQMAIPRSGVPDAVREQRVENTAGHIPDGCLIDN